MTPNEQWKKVQKLLSDLEESQSKELSRAQKKLLEKLMDALYEVREKDGLKTGTQISSLIDKVFDEFNQEQLKPIVRAIAEEFVKTVEAITKYYELQIGSASVRALSKDIEQKVLRTFGIEKTERGFRLIVGGYLDNIVNDPALRVTVQKLVMDASFGQSSFSGLMKQLGNVVTGTDVAEGAISKHFKTMAFDAMNNAARYESNEFGNSLGMTAAIYTGTVIEESRCFCEENAGKVILIEEANREWPKKLNTECGPRWSEKSAGKYRPTVHLGGHRCRHGLRYISNAEAIRRDPTLRENSSGKLIRA